MPMGVNGWSPICTTWLNPHYEGKQAVLGLTITEKALRDSGMSSMEFYEYWKNNTKFGRRGLRTRRLSTSSVAGVCRDRGSLPRAYSRARF